jgi:hypothetical protein
MTYMRVSSRYTGWVLGIPLVFRLLFRDDGGLVDSFSIALYMDLALREGIFEYSISDLTF